MFVIFDLVRHGYKEYRDMLYEKITGKVVPKLENVINTSKYAKLWKVINKFGVLRI